MNSTDQQPVSTSSKDASNENDDPLAAWFLGPRAENAQVWGELLNYIFQDHVHWRRNYMPTDPVVVNRVRRRSDRHEEWVDKLTAELDGVLNDLKQHFPFHSPRYVAHMLSEQTLPSVLGYFAGMLFNPNNVTPEAAPITVRLEIEVGQMIAKMLGFDPEKSWAHICSGGTVANIEALWIARMVQFVPFTVKEYCLKKGFDFVIKCPNLTTRKIVDSTVKELINIKPNESIFMLRKLVRAIHQKTGRSHDSVISEVNEFFHDSQFNVARRGFHSILNRIGLSPVIFASAAAHYSIAKALNLLGYGEDALRVIPVNSRFQADINVLQKQLNELAENEYIACVVGVVCFCQSKRDPFTSENGTRLRDERKKQQPERSPGAERASKNNSQNGTHPTKITLVGRGSIPMQAVPTRPRKEGRSSETGVPFAQ